MPYNKTRSPGPRSHRREPLPGRAHDNLPGERLRQVDYSADHRAAVALHDCFTVFGDAVDQIRGSLKQMRKLTGTGEELRFQMSNVQTWMSAALTNEDTCVDGFQDVADGPVKMDVCDRTVKVKEVTSNALALVNSYAKVMVP
ncbi:UNVERIFIED_CONTAM: Pectinesterase inhibitor 3 [Sesamum calycinum]|uniref:Pectinesterase inhibitor 3 n=1 Tax=Sesamum calycinum TaxID=2727403 RepID=A0AAW2QYL6_9LAMI